DLMTFRDLYGFVTPEKLAESKQLQKATGVKFVTRDRAEAELFGGSAVATTGKEQKIDEKKELGGAKYSETAQAVKTRSYTTEEIEKGVVLNAAVILKDPSKIKQSMKDIEEVAKKNGLDLRVVTWQKAAGNLGQF